MTSPYQEDGAPREIWPDGRFPGYPPRPDLQPDNRDGYRFNSMPLLYLRVTDVRSGATAERALFLIDTGAHSEAQWSLHLKHELLGLPADDVSPLTLQLEDRAMSGHADGIGLHTMPWTVRYTAPLRIDSRGNPSPRENSVLGMPWVVRIKPLFEYDGCIPSPEERLAIRFPIDGSKGWYRVNVRNPANNSRFALAVAIDTGAPYSVIPQGYINALGLQPLRTESYPDGKKKIFTWFNYEERLLYDFELCEASGAALRWCVRNSPPEGVGMTARSKEWGLLGVDFLLAVKPLIVYGEEDLPGQVKGVDYHEANLLEEIPDQSAAKSLMERELSLGRETKRFRW